MSDRAREIRGVIGGIAPESSISSLRVPTLLIVNDMPVLRMNREALSLLKGERRLEIIHGADEAMAGHIVEKATRWLTDRLQVGAAAV